MTDWQFDFDWLQTRHYVKDHLGLENLPDLNGILLLIGIQELGRWRKAFTKEEKQDLMHIAVCRLLESKGVFAFKGRDQDGWPHYEQKKTLPVQGVDEQEQLLKELIVGYFQDRESSQGAISDHSNNRLAHEEE